MDSPVRAPRSVAHVNRLDRLYALVEELRAAGAQGRSARRLAEHFEVSVRTIERDILALQEAGVPISAELGRRGGYVLDRTMTLPPLNFTPSEAVAMGDKVRAAGYLPVHVELSELKRGGGSVKCAVAELRP